MSEVTRIAVTGGGTGGHLSPAVATITALRELPCGLRPQFLYLGSRTGVEARVIPLMGVPYRAVSTGKLRRYLSVENLLDAARLPLGVLQSLYHLARFRPHVLFATGGYVSVPPVIAAALLRTPVLLHEQTGSLGLANRISLRFATAVALSVPGSVPGKRSVVTGNPVRSEVLGVDRERARRRFELDPGVPTIYVTGGAQGAHAINEVVRLALPELLELAQVIHQCGNAPGTREDYEALLRTVKELPQELQRRYTLTSYVGQEIGDVYAASDLVVGRAGAGTVNEVATLGKPAIFVPLPIAAGDEQRQNARRLADLGGAVVIEQEELSPERLVAQVRELLSDPERLRRMGEASLEGGSRGAA